MKKILSILGAISLVGTSATSLVACNKPQYSEKELAELKEKNKIDTKDQTIRDNLEWITPQEKPFINVDNKYYFVVWRGDKNVNWRIAKFKNNTSNIKIDNFNNCQLEKNDTPLLGNNLYISKSEIKYALWEYNSIYFKTVYRWNLDNNIPELVLVENGNVKVNNE